MDAGTVKNRSRKGMTLLELLVGTAILIILVAAAGSQIKGILQRAKVMAAKSTINGFALCLSMIKNDTGLYPLELSHVKQASAPEGISVRNWYGPYGHTLSLTDPWGNPYFYELIEGIVFGPDVFQKFTPPQTQTIVFQAPLGPGTLIIDNLEITAGRVWLNGVEIVSPDEFKHWVNSTITKTVNLLANNTLEVRLTSNPASQIFLRFTSPFSTDTILTLGSYGRDGEAGGTGWNADIIYGDF